MACFFIPAAEAQAQSAQAQAQRAIAQADRALSEAHGRNGAEVSSGALVAASRSTVTAGRLLECAQQQLQQLVPRASETITCADEVPEWTATVVEAAARFVTGS